ncbi:MAG TPA: ABC transporter permease [Lachnospiraceae bacterium]|nr:iron ABC transporter permease [uncultured Lachnoclostridium sp.]HAU88041.1 ABC transporter permease [Lachnospiraceae bacterium]
MRKKSKICIAFITITALLNGLFLLSVNLGSIQVTFVELLRGLWVEYNPNVAAIYDLRFPRIIVAMLAGAALAVAGVLFQAVLKNPLADPGIIGISSGASFAAMLVTICAPACYLYAPLFACLGGLIAFFMVYSLSWKGGLSPLRILLVGIAIDVMLKGLMNALDTMTGGSRTGVASIVEGNITMKTWKDVQLLAVYVLIGLVIAQCFSGKCNLLSLEDKTARAIGVNIGHLRVMVSIVAVLLTSIATAIVGVVGFLGLIVPHIARIFVGSNHKILLPFSMLAGAFTFLLADTVGRTICAPYEISASVVMAVVGGPFFILLLRKSGKTYGN